MLNKLSDHPTFTFLTSSSKTSSALPTVSSFLANCMGAEPEIYMQDIKNRTLKNNLLLEQTVFFIIHHQLVWSGRKTLSLSISSNPFSETEILKRVNIQKIHRHTYIQSLDVILFFPFRSLIPLSPRCFSFRPLLLQSSPSFVLLVLLRWSAPIHSTVRCFEILPFHFRTSSSSSSSGSNSIAVLGTNLLKQLFKKYMCQIYIKISSDMPIIFTTYCPVDAEIPKTYTNLYE